MVRTDPGALSDTTVAWIDRRGNPPRDRWPWRPCDTGTGVRAWAGWRMLGVECVVYSPPGRDPALLLKRKAPNVQRGPEYPRMGR